MQAMSHSVWLTIDIGNSAIKAGVYVGDHIQEYATTVTLDEILKYLINWNDRETFERIGLSSVVPDLAQRLIRQLNELTSAPILRINSHLSLPIKVNYQPIESLGADRLVAACAGWSSGQGATIIVDAGSAITIDLVSKDGIFEGGIIMPGPELANRSIRDYTANVDAVLLQLPHGAIGSCTVEALQHGLINGMIDAVTGAIDRINGILNEPTAIILTGGWSYLLRDWIPEAIVSRHLTLDGIKVLMHYNST